MSHAATPHLFVEGLTTIDYATLDARRGLLGDSLIADVELGGALDEQSMVLDFREVKRRLKRAIDDAVDHRLLVPRGLAGIDLHAGAARCELAFHGADGNIEYHAPAVAVAVLDAARCTPTVLARHLQPRIAAALPASIEHINLRLHHANPHGASYHYTHGLRRHGGHCQRLGHGHHSRVRIRVDGVRDSTLEQAWADDWDGVHLGTREDLLDHGNGQLRFGYDSAEGGYELALPESRCRLIDGASTVERLAQHIAHDIAARHPGRRIDVRAYEGTGKGGLATAMA